MEKNPTYLFVAAAALVDEKGRILVQKRPEGKPMAGLWEFPGGQDIEQLAFASEPLAEKHLILLLYICRRWTGQVESPEALDLQWLPVTEIDGLPMPPADGPLVQMLSNHLLAPA